MALPTAYSYSRLTTYDACSQKYKLVYIDRAHDIRQDTVATRIGNLCHAALEAFYEDSDDILQSPYHALTIQGGVWDKELELSGLQAIKVDLQRYTTHLLKIFERAAPDYTGPNPIRNKDGSVTKAPLMTGPGREYSKTYGLDTMAQRLDKVASNANWARWGEISISDVYGQSHVIMSKYTNSSVIDSILAIELPISEMLFASADAQGNKLLDDEGKPVGSSKTRGPHKLWVDEKGENELVSINQKFFMPTLAEDGTLKKDKKGNPVWSKTGLFHGYIDMVARDAEGRLLIIDHKSSMEQPSEAKVLRHEQLLAYGYAIYHLTGEMPYMIGINHLRTNKLVMAPFELERAEKAIARLVSIQNAIELKTFIKRDPDGFDSPCVKRATRADKDIQLCPGLRYCHPEVYEHYRSLLSDELFI